MNAPIASRDSRIPELDGLRGIAICMVLLHHYFFQPIQASPGTWLSYVQAAARLAWSGVDLFFVLSGFLIGGILLDARESSNYFRVFYTRRFLRIVPIYFVLLVVALALYRLVAFDTASRFSWMYEHHLPWLPHFLFLQNFWMATTTTFGALGLTITWSLAVEEQFYLTLPLLVRFLSQNGLAVALACGIILAPISRIALQAFAPTHYLSWYTLMPCRADSLLLGVVGAVLLRSSLWESRLVKNRHIFLTLLGLLAVGCAVLTLRTPDPFGFPMLSAGYSWLALFYLCLLLCGLLYRETRLGAALRWGWLRWIGSIAYGLYLFHEILLHFLQSFLYGGRPQHWAPTEFLISLVSLVLLLLICRLSWVFFEKPLIQLGHRSCYESSQRAPAAGEIRLSMEGTPRS